MRIDGRGAASLRKVRIYRSVLRHPQGSAYISMGQTRVLCAAFVEEQVPPWLRGRGEGWVTAEYGMMPGSVSDRAARGKVSGRSQEIQRLIGRSLRSIVDLKKLGERRVIVDCDVMDADGGTRTASITAAYVALREAIEKLLRNGDLDENPLTGQVAAVSVGLVDGEPLLDLCYEEDSRAEVDFNVVATGEGELIEVQGTAERKPFSVSQNQALVKLAMRGIGRLLKAQERCFDKDTKPKTILV